MYKNTEKRIKKYCEEQGLLQEGDGVVVGLSGGADSVCLLYILHLLQPVLHLQLCAVHINHGIRGKTAQRDAMAAKRTAKQWGIPFRLFTKDIPTYAAKQGLTQEEAGRKYRYDCFESVRQQMGYQKIAVAHHQDDQAETVLWQLFRGSGLRGAGGIRPKRGTVIRPLLCVTKQEILEMLQEEGISWQEDETNQESIYTRNKIRNTLIPWVQEEIQPMAGKHLAEFAGDCQMLWTYLEKQTDDAYGQVVYEKQKQRGVDVEALKKIEPVLQRRVLQKMLERTAGAQKDISRVHVEQIWDLANGISGKKCTLPYGVQAWKETTVLWMRQGDAEEELLEKCPISFQCILRTELPVQVPKNDCTKWFDCDRMYADAPESLGCTGELSLAQLPLEWRFPREGDYLILAGDGGKKRLSRLFIDEKIGVSQRQHIPVLALGHHIVWVPALGRTSAAYYVTEETKYVLQCCLSK